MTELWDKLAGAGKTAPTARRSCRSVLKNGVASTLDIGEQPDRLAEIGDRAPVEVGRGGPSFSPSSRSCGSKDAAMTAPRTESLRTHLETLIALARLLERVEASPVAVGADQYRALVGQLKTSLAVPLPEQALQAILAAHPATAELYENLHYEASGLSRSSLDRSVATEMMAAAWIHHAARRDD